MRCPLRTPPPVRVYSTLYCPPAGAGKEKKEKKAKKRKAEDEEPTVDAAAQDAGTVEEVGPGHVICALIRVMPKTRLKLYSAALSSELCVNLLACFLIPTPVHHLPSPVACARVAVTTSLWPASASLPSRWQARS